MSRSNAAGTLDKDSAAILYEGANMSQLSVLFKMDDRVLKQKMYGLQPCGHRGNASIYDVALVAQRMGRPTADQVEVAITRMNHADLPKELTKEFWAGQRSRQEYMLKEGELIPVAEVVSAVGDLLKLVKMSLNLAPDTIERRVEVSDVQRRIFKGVCDSTLLDMRNKSIEWFNKLKVKKAEENAASTPGEEDSNEL